MSALSTDERNIIYKNNQHPRDEYEILKSVLNYNPETGLFSWAKNIGKQKKKGDKAGTINGQGYVHICYQRKIFKAARIAFYFTHGWLPEYVDHINLDKADNRICNLRPACNRTNQYNQPPKSNNKSGVKGVCWHKSSRKWAAYITENNGKQRTLIRTSYFFEACCQAISARNKIHGEYAYLSMIRE